MKKRTAVTILLNIFFILLVLVIILPAAWLIMNSLKIVCIIIPQE